MTYSEDELRRHIEAQQMLRKVLIRGVRSVVLFGIGVGLLAYVYAEKVRPHQQARKVEEARANRAEALVRELREMGFPDEENKE